MNRCTDPLAAIEAIIDRNSILKHPFYQAWQRGDLSRAALQDYAAQYYRHVDAFPTYLSALHSHVADKADRQTLLENLIDEERGSENHPELWLQFADAIGADRDMIASTEVEQETARLIGAFRSLCRDATVAEGLAALYAYESQIPAVSETKIAGLRQFYGVRGESGLKYFQVHQEADIAHSAEERAMLAKYLSSDNAADCAVAAERVTSALWGVLTGVCERHGIAC